MQYRALIAVAALALIAGCGGPKPSTPAEHGEALLNTGSYDQAIAKLSEAIRLNPRDSQAYLHRGRAYQCRDNAGDLDAAIADFSTAIDLSPDDPEPLYSRAIAHRDRGKSTGSQEDAEQAEADQMAARALDSGVAANVAAMPDTSPPLEIDTRRLLPDAASPGPAAEAQRVETVQDAMRRIEAQAAAAARDGQRGDPGAGSRRFPSTANDALGRAKSNTRNQYGRTRSRTSQSGGGTGLPRFDSMYGARPRPGADPLAGSLNIPSSPMTPGATTGRSLGGTLPPVGNSPFSAPAPYPLPSSGAATSTSPYRSPYRSPFSSQTPQPTGRNSQQSLPPQQSQPRSFYTPYPRRTNHPPTVQHGDYNP